jgi:hypothetical protein
MQFHVTLTSGDLGHITGPQRWIDTVELVAFGNLDGERLRHIHIFHIWACGSHRRGMRIAS